MANLVHPPTAVVGITDKDWFESLRQLDSVDEVNFWQPSPRGAFVALQPGEPFLFKLHSPNDRIVGGGFFARYERMPISVRTSSKSGLRTCAGSQIPNRVRPNASASRHSRSGPPRGRAQV